MTRFHALLLAIAAVFSLSTHTVLAEGPDAAAAGHYQIQPGDVLGISVWKEEDLTQDVIVRPDGYISFPLIGEIEAAGHTLEETRLQLAGGLKKYIPDAVVTVSVRQLSGNRIYVIGKVNRPGEFPITRYVDVMQALSMAGGTSTYAALNKIRILRRNNGKLTAIPFRYGDVEKGEHLEQNIVLKAGDVVVVP